MRTLAAALVAIMVAACAPAHATTFTVPQFTLTGISSCPDDDGYADSPVGSPNYPTLISGGSAVLGVPYKASINGANGLGCRVAGVDYHVGTPNMVLLDPTTMPLPKGCTLQAATKTVPPMVNCSGSVTVSGYDFSLKGVLLTGSGTGTVTNNKFSFGPNCTDPVVNWSGSITFNANTIDGSAGFGKCSLNQGFGSFLNINPPAGGFVTLLYNYLLEVAQDAFDINQPSTGNVAVTIKFNLIYRQGSTGHPDGIQYCGGGSGTMTPNAIYHNTWYGNPTLSNAGVQPLHVEAQTCGAVAHISNTKVYYNTVLGTGKGDGGTDWEPSGPPPGEYSMNFGIACKQDDTSTNTNFDAEGNYVDTTGAIAGLTNDKCPSATWGAISANWDMTGGTKLPTNPK